MITITRQPDDIMLSGNPISVEVQATTPAGELVVERGGSRARIISSPGQGLPVNTSLSLFWTTPDGAQFQIAFHTDGPFPTAYEIPEYNGGNLGNYWSLVASTIGDNIDIAPWFQVYSEMNTDGTYSLWAVARSTDPGWNVRFLGADDGSVFTAEDNIQPDTQNEYRVRCDVVVNTTDGFRVAATVGAPPDERSRVPFDIDNILRNAQLAELEYPAVPAFTTSAPFAPVRIMDYYLRISERSEDEDYIDTKYLRDLRVMLGGVSNVLNAAGNYLETFDLPGKWLSSRPDRRRVGPAEPAYLSSIQAPNPITASAVVYGQPHLELETTNYDGEPTTSFLYQGELEAEALTPITWPVGVAALGIGTDVSYYRVRVVQTFQEGVPAPGAEPDRRAITEWRTFIVDRIEYESVRYLAYLNSFYTVEVLRCIGSVRHDIDIDVETTSVVRPVDAGIVVPDVASWSARVRDAYTFATGYKERLEIETVTNELYRSPRLYEITPTGFTPLVINGVSFPLHTTGQNLHAASIRCSLALNDRNYSRLDDLLTIPPLDFWASPDGEAWLGVNEEPWR